MDICRNTPHCTYTQNYIFTHTVSAPTHTKPIQGPKPLPISITLHRHWTIVKGNYERVNRCLTLKRPLNTLHFSAGAPWVSMCMNIQRQYSVIRDAASILIIAKPLHEHTHAESICSSNNNLFNDDLNHKNFNIKSKVVYR